MRALLAAALVAGVVTTVASPAGGTVCSLDQLTEDPSGSVFELDLSADGSTIALSSTADPFGTNTDRNAEIFTVDLPAGVLTQRTVSTGGGSGGIGANRHPSLTADGGTVVFDSDRQYAGSGNANADESSEIFSLTLGSTPVQRTFGATAAQRSSHPSVNASGTRLAYASRGNATNENGDGSWEIFHQRGTNTVHVTDQVTSGVGIDSTDPSLDDSGTRVSYSERGAVIIFTYDSDFSGGSPLTMGIAADGFEEVESELSGDGRFVVYKSDRDLDGAHPNAQMNVWRQSSARGALPTAIGPAPGFLPRPPTVSVNGARTAYGWTNWFRPNNPSGRPEAFVHDHGTAGGRTRAFGDGGASPVRDLSLSADGTLLAVAWQGDPKGTNPNLNGEVFLAVCGRPGPVFRDVPRRHAFFAEIQWLSAGGLAGGYPDHTFRPTRDVNRQQMANFLYGLAGRPAFTPSASPAYPDVPESHPFFVPIEWVYAAGVSFGYADGYHPTAGVRRAELVRDLYALAGAPAFIPPSTPTFSDVPASHPSFTRIEWAAAEGIVGGYRDGTFRPGGVVNRQQVAIQLLRFAQCCDVAVSA